ncbi:hypothetical protein R1flu_010548 [Riccia fluitans]|uniref:Protein kinase domain-containing protein n=1 Tax=Riccia fluitans TaxID=41844 RepID=A0ABD1Z5M0_9MARC
MSASWIKCELLERSQAEVHLAVDTETGKLFVVKNCDCDDKRTTRDLLNEITIFLVLDTPRVVQYLGSSFSQEDGKRRLNLFLEYMPGGSLRRHISNLGGRLKETLIKTYTRAIVEALHHLHDKGIVHGDVKADNILVGINGIKLCDFGGSKLLNHDSHRAMRGTPPWMAPEVVAKLDQGFPSDIWSLGCTVLEMATGQDPWGNVISKTDFEPFSSLVKYPMIRATFPDPPGKILTTKGETRKQKPKKTPANDTSQNMNSFTEFELLPISDSQTCNTEEAQFTLGGTPAQRQENGDSPNMPLYGLPTVSKVGPRPLRVNATDANSNQEKQTSLWRRAGHMYTTEKSCDPQIRLFESEPLQIRDERTHLNTNRTASKRDKQTSAATPLQSSTTTRESTTQNNPTIRVIPRNLTDQYPHHPEPRKQHESWETETTDNTQAVTSSQQLYKQPSEIDGSPSNKHRLSTTSIPTPKTLHHDQSNRHLHENSDASSEAVPTPSPQQSSEVSFEEMRNAQEQEGFQRRETSHQTQVVSVSPPGSHASHILSDRSDPPAKLDTDSLDTDTWETDKKNSIHANPHSTPARENIHQRSLSSSETAPARIPPLFLF